MADWKNNAVTDLKEYPYLRECLQTIPEEITSINCLMKGIKSSCRDNIPVQGGTRKKEDFILDGIDRKERLRINYKVAQGKIKRIERALSKLDNAEKKDIIYRDLLS